MWYWPLIHAFLKCAEVRHTKGLRFPRQGSLRFLQGISTKCCGRRQLPEPLANAQRLALHSSVTALGVGPHRLPRSSARGVRGTASLRGERKGRDAAGTPAWRPEGSKGGGSGRLPTRPAALGPSPTPESAGRPEGPAFPEGVWQIREGKKSEWLPLHSPGAVSASSLGLSRISEAILEAVNKE